MRNRWILLVLVLTISGIFVVACYTILSHPRVEDEEGEAYTGRDYRQYCTDCHIDYHNYPYGYYYGYYPDYYWSYPRWGHYYVYPWWWDRYWWDGDEGFIIQDEKIERRGRTLEPPYVPEPKGIFPPVLVEPKSSRGTTPKGTIERIVKEKQPEQKKEKKTEEKEKIPKKKR